MLLIIDNYDSFTHNLAQYIGEMGYRVEIHRNDHISIDQIVRLNPSHIVISPGPCDPHKAGISIEAVKKFYKRIPILGVCLGHQAIAASLGGQIVRANRIMHGKVSKIYHSNDGLFKDLPSPFNATRYHSLVVDPSTCPTQLEVTAWTEKNNGEVSTIMGIADKVNRLHGVQFHPESIASEFGHDIIRNFLVDN
jgi:anthranilate synthase component 2